MEPLTEVTTSNLKVIITRRGRRKPTPTEISAVLDEVRARLLGRNVVPAANTVAAIRSDIGTVFGSRALKLRREQFGMTQTELAKQSKLAQSTIAAMEAGKRPIGKRTAQRLAKALSTDYRLFLTDNQE